MDGKDSDIASVKQAIAAYGAMTKTGRYANATEKYRRNYDQAFRAVALLLAQERVTQEQIDTVLAQLKAAEQRLNGKDTNFSSLQKLVDREVEFQASNYRFIYASDDVKAAYLTAFEEVQAVLANPGASREEVKAATANLREAKRKLNGKRPQKVQTVSVLTKTAASNELVS